MITYCTEVSSLSSQQNERTESIRQNKPLINTIVKFNILVFVSVMATFIGVFIISSFSFPFAIGFDAIINCMSGLLFFKSYQSIYDKFCSLCHNCWLNGWICCLYGRENILKQVELEVQQNNIQIDNT